MKRHRHLAFVLTALISSLLLSACGFALRGSTDDFKLPFKTLHVNVSDNTLFSTTVRRLVRSAGAEVVKDPKQADARLEILARKKEREILSLTPAGRPREFALYYTFSYQVSNRQNRILLGPLEIRLRRTLTYNESQTYAKEKEADLLYTDMENTAIVQVIRKIAGIEAVRLDSDSVEPPL